MLHPLLLFPVVSSKMVTLIVEILGMFWHKHLKCVMDGLPRVFSLVYNQIGPTMQLACAILVFPALGQRLPRPLRRRAAGLISFIPMGEMNVITEPRPLRRPEVCTVSYHKPGL